MCAKKHIKRRLASTQWISTLVSNHLHFSRSISFRMKSITQIVFLSNEEEKNARELMSFDAIVCVIDTHSMFSPLTCEQEPTCEIGRGFLSFRHQFTEWSDCVGLINNKFDLQRFRCVASIWRWTMVWHICVSNSGGLFFSFGYVSGVKHNTRMNTYTCSSATWEAYKNSFSSKSCE